MTSDPKNPRPRPRSSSGRPGPGETVTGRAGANLFNIEMVFHLWIRTGWKLAVKRGPQSNDRALCGKGFRSGTYGAPFVLEDPQRGIERLTHEEGRLCPDCFRRMVFVRV